MRGKRKKKSKKKIVDKNVKPVIEEVPFLKSIDFNIPSIEIDLDSNNSNEDPMHKKQNIRLIKPPEFTVAGYTKHNVSDKIHDFIDAKYHAILYLFALHPSHML